MEDDKKKDPLALVSIVFGIISLIIWIFPPLGAPLSLTGLILGVKSHRLTNSNIAILGIILSSVGLGLSLLALSYGIYLGLNS